MSLGEVYSHVYRGRCACTHIHIHIHTHMWTHIHTHTYFFCVQGLEGSTSACGSGQSRQPTLLKKWTKQKCPAHPVVSEFSVCKDSKVQHQSAVVARAGNRHYSTNERSRNEWESKHKKWYECILLGVLTMCVHPHSLPPSSAVWTPKHSIVAARCSPEEQLHLAFSCTQKQKQKHTERRSAALTQACKSALLRSTALLRPDAARHTTTFSLSVQLCKPKLASSLFISLHCTRKSAVLLAPP